MMLLPILFIVLHIRKGKKRKEKNEVALISNTIIYINEINNEVQKRLRSAVSNEV